MLYSKLAVTKPAKINFTNPSQRRLTRQMRRSAQACSVDKYRKERKIWYMVTVVDRTTFCCHKLILAVIILTALWQNSQFEVIKKLTLATMVTLYLLRGELTVSPPPPLPPPLAAAVKKRRKANLLREGPRLRVALRSRPVSPQ